MTSNSQNRRQPGIVPGGGWAGAPIPGRKPVVALDQGPAAVREPVELEVIVGGRQRVELLEYFFHWHRALVRRQRETTARIAG